MDFYGEVKYLEEISKEDPRILKQGLRDLIYSSDYYDNEVIERLKCGELPGDIMNEIIAEREAVLKSKNKKRKKKFKKKIKDFKEVIPHSYWLKIHSKFNPISGKKRSIISCGIGGMVLIELGRYLSSYITGSSDLYFSQNVITTGFFGMFLGGLGGKNYVSARTKAINDCKEEVLYLENILLKTK